VTAAIGDGTVLAAGADPAIRVWTPAVDRVIEVTPGLEPGGAVALVALPGERGIAALVAGERELRRWDRDGRPLPAVLGADTALTHLATTLGGDDPLVVAVLAGRSPRERAATLVAGTRLGRRAGAPAADDQRNTGGSDDIGDVSWNVPTVVLRYPANIPGLPGHNWANAIAMATPIAHKGVVAGAKVMAPTPSNLNCP
jgi:hypothetical protein